MGPGGPDDSKPTPPSATPDENLADNVAPKNQPQSELVLRKLKDLIKNDKVTPEMLKDLGMNSKEELNQFVTKFDKAPKSTPGPGREIEVKPGKPEAVDPNRQAPRPDPRARRSARKTIRDRGQLCPGQRPRQQRGDPRSPPPELRAGVDAYRNSLARSKTLNPTRRPAARHWDERPAGGP